MLFLGIDGGGTKTAAVLIDENGRPVAEGMGGPSNAFHSSPEIVMDSMRQAVDTVLEGVGSPVTRAACVGGHKEWVQEYMQTWAEAVPIEWVSERSAGFAAAGLEEDVGVVIIAGTGSSFQGRTADGDHLAAGGWGSLLGDEGSAYDIALQGIKRALRVFDGRLDYSALADRLIKYFGSKEEHTFVPFKPIAFESRVKLAGFAVEVAGAAAEDDAAACAILHAAGESLGADALFVASKLFKTDDEFPVVLSGGVFNAGELVITPIREAFAARFPNAVVMRTQVSPATGAARIAKARYEGKSGI